MIIEGLQNLLTKWELFVLMQCSSMRQAFWTAILACHATVSQDIFPILPCKIGCVALFLLAASAVWCW